MIGHALVGAFLSSAFGLWGIAGAAVIAIAYWLAKELPDLARGGQVLDGLEDALAVSLGAWYSGHWWWPLTILLSSLAVMVMDQRQRK